MPFASAAVLQVVIASGASLSGGVEVGQGSLAGIYLPTFTSAALSFQVSVDGTTWVEALDAAGAAITIGASVGDRFFAAPAGLQGTPWIKVRSGLSGASVNQGAARTISLVVK